MNSLSFNALSATLLHTPIRLIRSGVDVFKLYALLLVRAWELFPELFLYHDVTVRVNNNCYQLDLFELLPRPCWYQKYF